eukprot:TRINITY_DN54373_c0_g1_i1.p1 TRINITY_DN54373_c0_g1~~TRINITY_DN54373_c0_g1_i1.p1  ORF type:complete len:304 (-),score=3.45 TRINITY_DN54373_c0_g1_i1:326-1237(-)
MEQPAAGGGKRQVWDSPLISEQAKAQKVVKVAPNPHKRRLGAQGLATVTKPEPVVPSLDGSQKFPSRDQLRSQAVGGFAPHPEFHIPGYSGHRPKTWLSRDFNSRKLQAASEAVAAGTIPKIPPVPREAVEVPKPSKKRFEVADHQREGTFQVGDTVASVFAREGVRGLRQKNKTGGFDQQFSGLYTTRKKTPTRRVGSAQPQRSTPTPTMTMGRTQEVVERRFYSDTTTPAWLRADGSMTARSFNRTADTATTPTSTLRGSGTTGVSPRLQPLLGYMGHKPATFKHYDLNDTSDKIVVRAIG